MIEGLSLFGEQTKMGVVGGTHASSLTLRRKIFKNSNGSGKSISGNGHSLGTNRFIRSTTDAGCKGVNDASRVSHACFHSVKLSYAFVAVSHTRYGSLLECQFVACSMTNHLT